MKILITGASGFIGTALQPFLQAAGHQVVGLKRSRDPNFESVPSWSPTTGEVRGDEAAGADAVIHLAGTNIGAKRWTTSRKRLLWDSRIGPTQRLCEFLAAHPTSVSVFICPSGTNYYGDRGDEWLDEASQKGKGFLAELAAQWEQATEPARSAGIRVVNARFGLVLSPRGGALLPLLRLFRLGLGGRLGSGHQYWSWVALDDLLGAVLHVFGTPSLSGPVNFVAPAPVTNREFTRVLATALHRPAILPAPALALRVFLGEMADELLLSSARIRPAKLVAAGYGFRYTDLEVCLRDLLRK